MTRRLKESVATNPNYKDATFITTTLERGKSYIINGAEYYILDDNRDYGTNEERDNYKISLHEAYLRMALAMGDANALSHDYDLGGISGTNTLNIISIEKSRIKNNANLDVSLHVGADADMINKISLKIPQLNAKGLGLGGTAMKQRNALINENFIEDDSAMDKVNGIYNYSNSGYSATAVIEVIEEAIKSVSKVRSMLGAVQNRLEHTVKNLDNVIENTTASESRIRDTDMAKEMVKYSNNNILIQAGQSMLAQSNQSKQGILALLQ